MRFHAQSVSASAAGDYYQLWLGPAESDGAEDDPYEVKGTSREEQTIVLRSQGGPVGDDERPQRVVNASSALARGQLSLSGFGLPWQDIRPTPVVQISMAALWREVVRPLVAASVNSQPRR